MPLFSNRINPKTGNCVEVEFKFYIFSSTETGETWGVKSDSFRDAVEKLPEDAQWDDWFNI